MTEPGGADEPTDEIAALRAELALLLAVTESASDVVTVLGLDGTLKRAFVARDRIVGYDPREVEARSILELVHPDDREQAVRSLQTLAQGPGTVARTLLRVRNKQGGWVHLETVAVNRTDDPAVGGIITQSHDVGERLELERHLRVAQRMESVGRLAAGIVHDFNNLLAVVLLSAARARLRPSAALEALEEIERAAVRGSGLTKRLLALVRDRPVEPRRIDLAHVVEDARRLLTTLLPEGLVLDLRTVRTPVPIFADPSSVEQALLNLVLNARDALAGRAGSIRVSLDVQTTDAGEVAVLTVEDDGVGMDEATLRRAAEPFFTTKAPEHGTGLGLYAVSDFARRAGGDLRIDSAPGLGTRCRVTLPVHEAASFADAPAPAARRSAIAVLLVEDDPSLRAVLARVLEAEGCVVVQADDGTTALELASTRGDLQLLITDVGLPHVGGWAVIEALRQEHPELAVVAMSGHAIEAPTDDPNLLVLQKPFGVEELWAAVASMLPRAARPGG